MSLEANEGQFCNPRKRAGIAADAALPIDREPLSMAPQAAAAQRHIYSRLYIRSQEGHNNKPIRRNLAYEGTLDQH